MGISLTMGHIIDNGAYNLYMPMSVDSTSTCSLSYNHGCGVEIGQRLGNADANASFTKKMGHVKFVCVQFLSLFLASLATVHKRNSIPNLYDYVLWTLHT